MNIDFSLSNLNITPHVKVATIVGNPKVIIPPKVIFFIKNNNPTKKLAIRKLKIELTKGIKKLIPEKKNLYPPKPKLIFKNDPKKINVLKKTSPNILFFIFIVFRPQGLFGAKQRDA